MRPLGSSRLPRRLGLALGLALSLAGAASGAAPATSSPVDRFLELEVASAQRIDLYLVLARDGRSLEIRARGMVLDRVALAGATVVSYRTARHPSAPPSLPEHWEVTREPAAEHRKLIAPEELKPYDEDAAVGASAPEILPEPPSAYDVGLNDGWELHVVQESRATSLWGQIRQAVTDGWSRLRLNALDRPPALVLTVTEKDGRRLHQLFRVGRTILIDPTIREPQPPSEGTDGARG